MAMYDPLPAGTALTQGDVIDGCPVFILEPTATGVDLTVNPTRREARVLVMTQACDVAQAKSSRIVVATVHEADALVSRGILKSSLVRDQVRRGHVFGWYFLPAAAPPLNLPESLVNLRDLHTIDYAVLEHLIASGRGVCRLLTPYREHLAQHFAVTDTRIGLPEPYQTTP